MAKRLPFFAAPLAATLAIAAVVGLLDHFAQERFRSQERARAVDQVSAVRARLEGALHSRLFLTQGLVTHVSNHPYIDQKNFERLARGLVAGKHGIRAIQLARNTVVSHVYPLIPSEDVRGLRLLDLLDQRVAVERAIETGRTVVAGPVELVQGGVAFVAGTPIYLTPGNAAPGSGDYWGLATVLVDAYALYEAAGLSSDGRGDYEYAIRGRDGLGADGAVFYGDRALFAADPVVMPVSLPNGSWQIAACPVGGWPALLPYTPWWRAGGALIALLGGLLTALWMRYPTRLRHDVEVATAALRAAHDALERKVYDRTSALANANEALQRSEARLAEAQHIARVGSWEWDFASDELHWSDQTFRIFGYQAREFTPTYESFLSAVHPDDRERVERAVRAAIDVHEPYGVDHRIVRPNGAVRIVHEQGWIHLDGDGKPARMAGTVQDITERKAAEDQLAYMAYHDALTGLPNRALLRDRLEHALERAERIGHQVGLVFLDLDCFKTVNDSLGHAAGDRLLVAVGRRLGAVIRRGDTLARLGGDEFTILLEEIEDADQVAAVVNKLRQACQEPFDVEAAELFVTASMGVSVFPDDGRDAETLMKNADAAMYRAKDLGRDACHFFSEELERHAQERLVIETGLRRAIDREELELCYQPLIELATGRIVGLEALARWHHPTLGTVEPEQFIPVAEETGLIEPIGRWVLTTACRQLRAWDDAGLPPVRMLVNLSVRQLRHGDLAGEVERALAEADLPAGRLGLEVTESLLLVDDTPARRTLERLQALDVHIAIDDFGTGHSALAYLKRFSIDSLKIDRAFVRDVTVDPNDAAIIEAIIAMARKLDLRVVAEGVETYEQEQALRGFGCDLVQGFLYSAPLAAEKIPALLEGRVVAGSGEVVCG